MATAVAVVIIVPMPVIIGVAVVMLLVLAVVVSVIVPVLHVLFVPVEVPLPARVTSPVGSFAPARAITSVSKPRIEAAIHVCVETHWAVEPGSRADEDSTHKPLRPVITEGRAVIGGVVVVPVRTDRRNGNRFRRYDNRCRSHDNRRNRGTDPNMNIYLRGRLRSGRGKPNSGKSKQNTQLECLHLVLY